MTDHRAEAEAFLELVGDTPERDGKIVFALLGIGHALLAQPATGRDVLADLRAEVMADPEARAVYEETTAKAERLAATQPDTDTRCTTTLAHGNADLQCLDHQGHTGPHQWPTT